VRALFEWLPLFGKKYNALEERLRADGASLADWMTIASLVFVAGVISLLGWLVSFFAR
jgi:hypothetical protein